MKELLLPAGNPEKLTAALRYGADAVYLAGKVFGMRSAAANFSDEELFDAVKYAHSLGKKVYITVDGTPWETPHECACKDKCHSKKEPEVQNDYEQLTIFDNYEEVMNG
jgi:collagenase-like PrtC family protease